MTPARRRPMLPPGLIIVALVLQQVWLTLPLMLLIGIFTAIVLVGLNHMLDDEDGTRIPD